MKNFARPLLALAILFAPFGPAMEAQVIEKAAVDHGVLEGITSVSFSVRVDEVCRETVLHEDFATRLELQLRQNGLKVADKPTYRPQLHVTFQCLDTNDGALSYTSRMVLLDYASVQRNPNLVLFVEAPIWMNAVFGSSGKNVLSEMIQKGLQVHMDTFLNAYLKANPRP